MITAAEDVKPVIAVLVVVVVVVVIKSSLQFLGLRWPCNDWLAIYLYSPLKRCMFNASDEQSRLDHVINTQIGVGGKCSKL